MLRTANVQVRFVSFPSRNAAHANLLDSIRWVIASRSPHSAARGISVGCPANTARSREASVDEGDRGQSGTVQQQEKRHWQQAKWQDVGKANPTTRSQFCGAKFEDAHQIGDSGEEEEARCESCPEAWERKTAETGFRRGEAAHDGAQIKGTVAEKRSQELVWGHDKEEAPQGELPLYLDLLFQDNPLPSENEQATKQ